MLLEIKKFAEILHFKKNTVIFKANDAVNGFYYIESGEVRLYKMNLLGKEVEIARLQNGEYFGEAIIFVSNKYEVFAETLKPSIVYYFPKDKILEKTNQDLSFALFFIKLLAGKCVKLNKRIEILALCTIKERLIKFFLMEYQKSQSKTIVLKLKKGELAAQLCTISVTLSRNLNLLQRTKLIKVKGKTITILDLAKLQKEIS